MKIYLTSIAIFLCCGCFYTANAQTKYGSPITDSIMDFANSAQHDFYDVYGDMLPRYDKLHTIDGLTRDGLYKDEVRFLKPLIGSSTEHLRRGFNNDKLTLSFGYINKVWNGTRDVRIAASVDIRKELENLYKVLLKDPVYTFEKTNYYDAKRYIIYKNGYELISYAIMKDGDPYGYGDFRLNITEQPRDSIFVDEKKYNGIFPATISKENTPQIYEIKSDDGKKTELFNGIFGKNRQFKNGKVTLHGYGGLYDGVWYSEDWIANDVFVSFTPENTNDVVFGYFTEKFMQDFHLTIASHDKFQSRAIGNPHFEITGNNNCKWVKEIYDPYSIVRDKENAQKVEAKFAEQKRLHPEQWNANPNTVNVPIPTPKSNIPIQVEKVKSKCYSCDGHGWTEQINSYGLRLHEQCKVCGGKGYNYE